MTNLLTSHLDLRLHFMRVGDDGVVHQGYENDGMPFPTNGTGAVEGQLVCRQWVARMALTRRDRTTEYHQCTDTPAGTYWASTQTGTGPPGVLDQRRVPFAAAKWFRGRQTPTRGRSTCPDPGCCRQADPALAGRWAARSWPSAAVAAQILAPLASGTFPGVDESEVFRSSTSTRRPPVPTPEVARRRSRRHPLVDDTFADIS